MTMPETVHRRTFSPAYVAAAARVLHVLSHDTRLNLVLLLAQGEATVSELCELVGLAQSNVSHHLRILRDAGLVTDRREGQFVVYGVNVAVWGMVAHGFFDHLAEGRDEVVLRGFAVRRMSQSSRPGDDPR